MITVIFLLTIGFTNTSAQEREISEAEFKKIYDVWIEKEKNVPHRSTTKILVTKNGILVTDKTIIKEYISPEHYRLIEESNRENDNPKVETKSDRKGHFPAQR